jgi:hypothetical protein
MKNVFVLGLGCILGGVLGCSTLPASSTPSHADQVAAIVLATTVWNVASDACVAHAKASGVATSQTACAKTLIVAQNLLQTAAQAVDTGFNPKAGCAMLQAVALVESVGQDLDVSEATLAVIEDAMTLADRFTDPTCVAADAGTTVTPPAPPPAPPPALDASVTDAASDAASDAAFVLTTPNLKALSI